MNEEEFLKEHPSLEAFLFRDYRTKRPGIAVRIKAIQETQLDKVKVKEGITNYFNKMSWDKPSKKWHITNLKKEIGLE